MSTPISFAPAYYLVIGLAKGEPIFNGFVNAHYAKAVAIEIYGYSPEDAEASAKAAGILQPVALFRIKNILTMGRTRS